MATFRCAECSLTYATRNLLFAHLDAADHYQTGHEGVGAVDGLAALDSPSFRGYYAAQLGLDPELWERNLGLLRTPLPHTVRGTASSPHTARVLAVLAAQPGTSLAALPLRPPAAGWTLAARDQATASVVAAAQDIGALQRQEVCSMIPPLALAPRPHHAVLDLCAAPGSKTLMLLDAMHSTDEAGPPTGILVANDVSRDRAMTIAHRSRRQDRAPFLLLSCDARRFPSLYRRAYKLRYDRVLCDVPCSGDGTLRKNRSMWPKWQVKEGMSLHLLQLAILKRGVELLVDGGRLLYSTCSLNPLEDEAVIAAALRHFGTAALKLVEIDPSALEAVDGGCQGLSRWGVPSASFAEDGGTLYSSYEDVPADSVRSKKGKGVSLCRTMFAPLSNNSEEGDHSEPDEMAETNRAIAAQLHRCRRVLPSQGDTGGFFVALLERSRSAKEPQPQPEPEPEPEPVAAPDVEIQTVSEAEAQTVTTAGPQADKPGWGDAGRSSRRWIYRPLDAAALADFTSWYGLEGLDLDLLRVDGGGRIVLVRL